MGLFKGSNKLKAYFGAVKAKAMYLGLFKIWSGALEVKRIGSAPSLSTISAPAWGLSNVGNYAVLSNGTVNADTTNKLTAYSKTLVATEITATSNYASVATETFRGYGFAAGGVYSGSGTTLYHTNQILIVLSNLTISALWMDNSASSVGTARIGDDYLIFEGGYYRPHAGTGTFTYYTMAKIFNSSLVEMTKVYVYGARMCGISTPDLAGFTGGSNTSGSTTNRCETINRSLVKTTLTNTSSWCADNMATKIGDKNIIPAFYSNVLVVYNDSMVEATPLIVSGVGEKFLGVTLTDNAFFTGSVPGTPRTKLSFTVSKELLITYVVDPSTVITTYQSLASSGNIAVSSGYRYNNGGYTNVVDAYKEE